MRIRVISDVPTTLLLAGCDRRSAISPMGERALAMSGFGWAFRRLMACLGIPGGGLAVMAGGEGGKLALGTPASSVLGALELAAGRA